MKFNVNKWILFLKFLEKLIKNYIFNLCLNKLRFLKILFFCKKVIVINFVLESVIFLGFCVFIFFVYLLKNYLKICVIK